MELQLLEAKDAVFRLIRRYCTPIHISDNNSKLYFYNYCTSDLERAFNSLEISDDYIEEFAFYQLWEENNRKLWAAKGNTDEMPDMWTAEVLYSIFGSSRIGSKSSEV